MEVPGLRRREELLLLGGGEREGGRDDLSRWDRRWRGLRWTEIGRLSSFLDVERGLWDLERRLADEDGNCGGNGWPCGSWCGVGASVCPGGRVGAAIIGFSCCSFMVVTMTLTCLMSSVVSTLGEVVGGVATEDGSGAWTGGCAGAGCCGIWADGWWAGINWLRWWIWVWACDASCCFSMEFCSLSWAIWIWSNWFWACDWAWDCWCIISPVPNWFG